MPSAALLAALAAVLTLSSIGEATAGRTGDRVRAAYQPVKDCTPYNSRYGFYGNIWCTPAEQRRWEIWQGRRSLR